MFLNCLIIIFVLCTKNKKRGTVVRVTNRCPLNPVPRGWQGDEYVHFNVNGFNVVPCRLVKGRQGIFLCSKVL